MSDNTSQPRITIVTPSLNHGKYIEETIQSVLIQDYPNLEYIIIDGGSTDNTLETIERYKSNINYWVSEPDNGQADAVNKGWRHSTGQILGWLNSDDRYEPGALFSVADIFMADPNAVMVYGDCEVIDQESNLISTKIMDDFSLEALLYGRQMPQPAVFVTKNAAANIGFLDESLQWALDTDFFIRMWLENSADQIKYLPKTLAVSREYPNTKSNTGIEKITQERRLALKQANSNRKWKSHLGPHYRRAVGHTYIREATFHFKARQPIRACFSLLRAWITNPKYYSQRGIKRILAAKEETNTLFEPEK